MINEKEIEFGYGLWWHHHYPSKSIDEALQPFLDEKIEPKNQWLRATRESLFLTSSSIAEKLGVTRQAYARLEKAELTGAITIKSLSKIAEAMDCELVYAIRPKKRTLFSKIIWKKLLPEAKKHHMVNHALQKHRANALMSSAAALMNKYEFRLRQGWSER